MNINDYVNLGFLKLKNPLLKKYKSNSKNIRLYKILKVKSLNKKNLLIL